MTAAAVIDIEGTTSSTASVVGQLFPYARERLAAHVRRPDPDVRAVLEEVRREIGRPHAGPDELAAVLTDWLDRDSKTPPLKTLQGLIWADGFAVGDLVGHVHPDVPFALARWRAAGVELHVYSSGSVLAQQLWFRHSSSGDLSGCFGRYFDTSRAGPKRETGSYGRIAVELGISPAEIVFLSDVRSELDAAQEAGWATIGVRRPDESPAELGDRPIVAGFDELDLDPRHRPRTHPRSAAADPFLADLSSSPGDTFRLGGGPRAVSTLCPSSGERGISPAHDPDRRGL